MTWLELYASEIVVEGYNGWKHWTGMATVLEADGRQNDMRNQFIHQSLNRAGI